MKVLNSPVIISTLKTVHRSTGMPLLHSHFLWHKISSSEGIYSLLRSCFKEKRKVFFFLLYFVWNVFAQGESCNYLTRCFSVSVSFYLQIFSFSVTLPLLSFWRVVSLPCMNKGRCVIVFVVVILAFYHIGDVLLSSRQRDLTLFVFRLFV